MSFPFVQARWFHPGGNTPVNRIVIHTMEYPEKPTAAEDIAKYFQRTDKKASAHYCCDDNSTIQCVKNADIAFHAPPNTGSIGIEHGGYARQSAAEWQDDYSTKMLRDQSAPLVKLLMREFNIPHVWLGTQDLRAGYRGITSHNNVSKAFGQSTHTDPGPFFPVDDYMAWTQPDLNPNPQEDDMASKLWRPVGQPGQPNVGGEFVQEGHLFVALSAITKQQLANSEANGDPAKLHVQDAEPELWKAITDDYKNVVE